MSQDCGVYLIVSPTNGRYVGSSVRLSKRFNRYKNMSCKNQKAIYSSLKKYGYKSHKIKVLFYCDKDELLFWERVFGDIYLSSANFKNGLNLVLPPYDAKTRQSMSKELRERISATQKQRFKDPSERERTSILTKKGFTEEVKQKMSIIHKARYENEDLRKMRSRVRREFYEKNPDAKKEASEAAKKRYEENPSLKEISKESLRKYREENPNAHRERLKKMHQENPELGKIHGEKLRKRYIDNPNLREIASKKTKEHLKKHGHPLSKKVININTNEVFNSVKEACSFAKISETSFRRKMLDKNINYEYQYLKK